ncbi:MAG: nucleotidyltransferase family protein [Sulfurimonas sp.]|jgi:MurNAc alpha-1-phosphate uridylyltransferase
MKAMILAAGRGERMRPLTDALPKPLLKVRGKPLIVWHIEKLASCGFKEIIINIAHLGYKIPELLGDGRAWGIEIKYSDEQNEGALESGGGIIKALPLLGREPFLVVNGDVFCDYQFDANFELHNKLAHLILVPNPDHNSQGDFGLKDFSVLNNSLTNYTFSGIGYYNPEIFDKIYYGKCALAPIIRDAIDKEKVSGELYDGIWHDIGTPQRLQFINRQV